MFCALGLIFGGTEGIGSLFHVLRSRTHFRLYQVRRVPFLCIALPDSFSAVPRASGPVFDGAECFGSHFHVLRARTHFRRYRGRRFSFSCFARQDSFSTVPSASSPVFMFCVRGIVFSGIEGIRSLFHVLHSRTRFRRCRVRRVPFSCFARAESFSAVSRASGPFFMFCALGLVFGGTECVRSRFHVLCSRSRFRWCRARRVLFSRFARPDSFWTVLMASGPIFMFCAPGLIFDGTEGVGSRFYVLRSRSRFRRYQGRRVPF
jgi:hypothetical protein